MYRICIDVGGTFTDCLVLDEDRGELHQFKSPTTPSDPSVGFLNALQKAADAFGKPLEDFMGEVDLLIHGTTLATNTLINEDGARTGMITNKDSGTCSRSAAATRTCAFRCITFSFLPTSL